MVQQRDVAEFWQTGRKPSGLADSKLRAVTELDGKSQLPPEERAILERARSYGADHVFFRDRDGRSRVAEALVFDEDAAFPLRTDEEFARLHRRLWSWGAIPLVYRRLAGRVDVFRCAHEPDFDTGKAEPAYKFFDFINTAADITKQLETKPWWDLRRLANGSLWDDAEIARKFLSEEAAHATLLRHVQSLDTKLTNESHLRQNLRRRLLIISLLIAYLEDRQVFKLEPDFFTRFKPGAEKFFHVLADAESLIALLSHLEKERFNGNVFTLSDEEKHQLRHTPHLRRFAELIEGTTAEGGQQTLWRLYSFHDLPVELISHIYQLFVEDKTTCVYTPPFLARFMLEEALTPARMDRIAEREEIVFDPACGSGVFLVEAFKRLVLHWRKNNDWIRPPVDTLRQLMRSVRGTDIDASAVELAAFSLCLAMCEELDPGTILRTTRLFPALNGKTLIADCFFRQVREKKLPPKIGVIVGNPPFGSASDKGTTAQAYTEYLERYGAKSLPDKQSAYLFLHHSLETLTPSGVLCLLQKDNFLYNRRSATFRRGVFERWDVREILDFTPIRNLFSADPKVVVVLAEAAEPMPNRQILHAVFRRTVRTRAEHSFELDYYDMHWMPRALVLEKDYVWRCNLFGGGRAVSLVERLKKLQTLKQYIQRQGWDYGEGFVVGTPKPEPVKYLWAKPVAPAKAVGEDGRIDESLLYTQTHERFENARPKSRYEGPLILIRQTDEFRVAYWKRDFLTYGQEVLGIPCGEGNRRAHEALFQRLRVNHSIFRGWLVLTSVRAGIEKATALQKTDIDDCPFPDTEAELELSDNDRIILADAFDYYRDYQRLGELAEVMRVARRDDYIDYSKIFARQLNVVHEKLRPLPAKTWAGVACQPFVFGSAEPDWTDANGLAEKIMALIQDKRSATLTTVRIVRLFDGPFIFLIKPNRLRFWLRSIALRDADETLADLRAKGF